MKQFLILGACALFVACGASTNERGITVTTADSTASGSAYNSYDGFAPAAPSTSVAVPASTVTTPVSVADSVVTVNPAATTLPVVNPVAATAPVAASKPAVADDSADIKKGEALISKSDCFACHKVDVKVLGPSYKDVAAKYPNNAATVNQLVDKVKKGGSGVWGAIPMSPHPALSDDDTKAMVRYILSLK
ncbi:MAG: c-type cytochrome [Bacteroidota bacterium]